MGETYLVEVPHWLPEQRSPVDALGFPLWWRWQWLRGTRFRLTVTDVDESAVPPMVEGLRIVQRVPRAAVRLTGDQVAELGLPPGDYKMQGEIQPVDGQPVKLPDVDAVRVPVRWLYPADADRPGYSHRDADD